MRARYALIFGRGAERHELRRTAAEKGFPIAADLSELLLVTEPRASFLAGARTALVGRAWNSELEPLDRLDADVESAAAADDLRSFPRCYWGNFVLFTSDARGEPRAYRDPSGSVGAFHLPLAGQDLFFSDAEFARALGFLAGAEVDPRFAVHWLQFPFLKTERAGLMGVAELAPGAWRIRTDGAWATALGWDPWDHCSVRDAFSDRHRATLALRQTALDTIPRQVATGQVCLQLSGGLDSSIIGACLRQAGTAFEAIHFATSSSDGDERRFASDAASAYDAPLATIVEDALEASLETAVARSVLPGANPLLAPIERAILRSAGDRDADLLVDGGGGDNLFCYLATAAPVLDAFRHGPPGAALRSIGAVAEITHSTWWDVVRAAFRLEWRRLAGQRRWREDRRYLHGGVLLNGPEPHPWLAAASRAPQGKREHVETILQIQHFFDRRTDWTLPVLHPLMAQPLMELCLRIPSWAWAENGRDRSVARDAFKGLVPNSVLSRRMKGSLQGFIRRAFERLRPDLRALLLEGELRRTGILDVAAIEAVFADGWDADAPQLRLTEMASLELWMRSWRQ